MLEGHGEGEELTEKARAIKGPDEIKAMRCASHACEAACSEKNDNPAHLAFRSVGFVEGGTYPARWRLRSAKLGLDVEVTPVLANQELFTTVRYWEGAVDISGTRNGEPLSGRGYVELTGYAE